MLKCPLQSLDGTTLTLRSRLWNSTFIEVTCCWIVLMWPLCVVCCDFLTRAAACVFTQDYASVSHSLIVVKASLVLHTQAENMILRNPDIDVSSPRTALKYKLKVLVLNYFCFLQLILLPLHLRTNILLFTQLHLSITATVTSYFSDHNCIALSQSWKLEICGSHRTVTLQTNDLVKCDALM